MQTEARQPAFLSDYVAATEAALPGQESGLVSKPHGEMDELPIRPLFISENAGSKPRCVYEREKPVHRAIIAMACGGAGVMEIAAALGIHRDTVRCTLLQPWAKEEIAETISRSGRSAVNSLVLAACVDSVYKLIELRDDAAAPKEVQRKAANDILDRAFGKPNQPVTHREEKLEELTDEQLLDLVEKQRERQAN